MATIPGSTGNDNLVGTSADDFFLGSIGTDTITGNGGSDVLNYGPSGNYTGLAGPVTVTFGATLYAGTAVKPGGATDTFTGIRRVNGTTGADTLTGNTVESSSAPYSILLNGGGGNDTIDGKLNSLYMASYLTAATGVVVRLQTSISNNNAVVITGSAQDGEGGTDVLRNVVRVIGSGFDDTIYGTDLADTFQGSFGNDTYFGGLDNNILRYDNLTTSTVAVTAGAPAIGLFGLGTLSVSKVTANSPTYTDTATDINYVRGTLGNDTFVGTTAAYSWYSYRFRGDGGNDTINGQNNRFNRIDYSSATTAVSVDLQAGTAQDGLGGTDTLVSVITVQGSSFNDTLLGGAGDDSFLFGDSGAHTVNGREGKNGVYFTGSNGVTIDLGTSVSSDFGGYVGTINKPGPVLDTLKNISNAQGGLGSDTVYGTPGDNQLSGGPGSNTIDGRGGSDFVNYRYASGVTLQTHGATVNLGDGVNGTATNPWGGTDTLKNIENAVGTQFADTITGASLASGAFSIIRGDGGNDTLKATSAADKVMVDYADSLSGVRVSLEAGMAYDDGWFGGQDTLVNIRGVQGSAFADTITGFSGNELILAGAGNDLINARGGTDTFDGGAGIDVVSFHAASRLYGWSVAAGAGNQMGAGSVTGGTDSTNASITSVEVLQFIDGRVVYDVTDPLAVAYRMYDSAFGRLPDALGLNHWATLLGRGLSVDDMASGFSGSPEFQRTYGPLDNRGFVQQLYRNVLHREGEQAGVDDWTSKLDGSQLTRGGVLAGFSESLEHIGRLTPAVQAGLWDIDETAASVARLYYAALARAPDAGGLVSWMDTAGAGTTLAAIADGFAGSPEFQQKYGPLNNDQYVELLYNNVLGRGSDPEGKANWVNALNAGAQDRGDVLFGFSDSFEHQLRTISVIDHGVILA